MPPPPIGATIYDGSRYHQWYRNEKFQRYLDRQQAIALRKDRRKMFWTGVYTGWSALGWIVILSHYFGVGN